MDSYLVGGLHNGDYLTLLQYFRLDFWHTKTLALSERLVNIPLTVYFWPPPGQNLGGGRPRSVPGKKKVLRLRTVGKPFF